MICGGFQGKKTYGALAALFLIVICFHFSNFKPSTIPFTEDMGLSFAVADTASFQHLPLAGPPSHTGGRHIGPFFYWFVAAIYNLAQGDLFYTCLLFSLISLSGVFICSLILYESATFGRAIFFCVPIILSFSKQYEEIIRTSWEPHLFLAVAPLCLWAGYQLALRKPYAFLQFLVLGSLAIQLHYGAAPFLCLTLLVALIFRHRTGKQMFAERSYGPGGAGPYHPIPIVSTIAFLLILWIPFCIYELTYEETLGALFSHSLTNIPLFGLKQGVGFVAKFYFAQLFPYLEPNWRIALAFFCLCGLATLFLQRKNKLSFSTAFFGSVLVLNLFVYAALLSQLEPPIHSYYLYPLFWLSPLTFTLLASDLAGAFSYTQKLSQFSKANGLVIAVILSGGIAMLVGIKRDEFPFFRFHTLRHALEFAHTIQKLCGDISVEIETRSASKSVDGAYKFLLGPSYYTSIKNADQVPELFTRPFPITAPSRKILIACPQIYAKDIHLLEKEFPHYREAHAPNSRCTSERIKKHFYGSKECLVKVYELQDPGVTKHLASQTQNSQ